METIRNLKSKKGFTLIEMLVVVLVIIILMGVVFKLAAPAGGAAVKGQTVARIEILKALLEEFHAEYGSYPAIGQTMSARESMSFEFPWKGGMRDDMQGVFADQDYEDAPVFSFGLMSFFVNRYDKIDTIGHQANANKLFELEQWEGYNAQKTASNKDAAFAKRVAPIYRRLDGNGLNQYHLRARSV